ncbi:MAG TPA: YggS family pyridoxal phosphate-dependent enzyme [Spirochaetota bacterium]|nr:YggS family pyridoxal phosphate-dependent enzyme [Spirochaetota bacterium]HPJ35226.1 YggS family pyridoxal phosphate-dependent enzyme [Spirochaetota bacterium]
MTIIDNYRRIENEIRERAIKTGRDPEEIKIISVSKTFPYSDIQEAIDSGITLFGENKVQEANEKIPRLKGDFTFHMIGHLQTNKAKDAVRLFDLIHSVDKAETALKINNEALKNGKIQRVLIQIKTSDESTKSGILPENAVELAENILGLENIKLEGIMSIGPLTDDKNLTRKSFIETADTLTEINRSLSLDLKELSMGMSGDYLIAVEEGATMIRIGTAIFGKRSYQYE